MTSLELRNAIDAWLAGDPDAGTRAELEALVRRQETAALEERFAKPVGFGTAGLRALLGAGPARMNRAVVRTATAGLARWLLRAVPDAVHRGVVVAHDARRMSLEFAADTAAVLAASGIPAWVFPGSTPTPLAAFAVTALGAAAGVVVTASHNPKEYNGYKVYGPNGAQVIPPDDGAIAQQMSEVGPANAVPLLAPDVARARGLLREVGSEVRERYLQAILKERRHPGEGTELVLVYTALHGVGGALALEALHRAGFERVHPVVEQQEPDSEFPTVAFPNPEEPGALDLAWKLAEAVQADVVLANDPDADRLAVLARVPGRGLRQLNGNEVGVLLADYLLREGPKVSKPLVMTTVVSSAQLGQLAARLGAHYQETLTGFKWMANAALERATEGLHFVFGYEEALGYAVGPAVHDKDGIGAAVAFADLAGWARARGGTVQGALDDLARQDGVYGSLQRSVVLPGGTGVATMSRTMEGFRKDTPSAIAGRTVRAVRDYAAGIRRADGRSTPLEFPKTNLLGFELDGGARVLLRPSGTEPKLKLYVEVSEMPNTHAPLEVVRARVLAAAAGLADGMLELARKRGLGQT